MTSSEGDPAGPGDDAPAKDEQPIKQAQLAHRLEELFHGIQTTLFAQEMAAQQQLQSIADVWAATDRYRSAGHGQEPVTIPVAPNDLTSSDDHPSTDRENDRVDHQGLGSG